MELSPLFALSPLDGRYARKLNELRPFFSEYAFIKYRVIVEIYWLMMLAEHPGVKEVSAFSQPSQDQLMAIVQDFCEVDARRVKAIEERIHHDVKAIEYFLKEKVADNPELMTASEFIHFACTSEDINNLAYALMLKGARDSVLLSQMEFLIQAIYALSQQYADQPMLSRTHGQPASPTTVGKEMANFVYRLRQPYKALKQLEIKAKFNGAVGNFNAHLAAYPGIDWLEVSKNFVKQFDLEWSEYTTQIEPHDTLAEFLHILSRFNTILIDFDRDMWSYISLDYFRSKPAEEAVGSSTMPHKVNPIDFENSEGNLGIANALALHLAEKLPVSRWQRDLSDSTVLRNLGAVLGHSILSYQASLDGIRKLTINVKRLERDLERHWEVLAEPIQTVMRRYGIEKPYETMKAMTQNQAVDREVLHAFIKQLNIPAKAKEALLALTPASYLGNAALQTKKMKRDL